MRKKLIGLLVLGGFAAVLLVPAFSRGQFGQQDPNAKGGKKGGKGGKGGGFGGGQPGGGMPGGFGGGGKGGKKGGMGPMGGMPQINIDPDAIFNMMAKGSDAIVISTSGMLRPQLEQWAMDNGVTSGIITRGDFTDFYQSMTANMGGGFGGGGGRNIDPAVAAAQRFKQLDKNGDGYLNLDEMPANLKSVWKQYDTNNDGLIDLEEYKEFYAMTVSIGDAGLNATLMMIDELDQRPTVYRAGKLPKELLWFVQMDKDRDGQVGLYEWMDSGKPYVQFQQMDRNGDGLLTAEEVLAYMRAKAGMAGGTLADAVSSVASLGNRQQPGMGANNMMQWQNFGAGNNGKGKKGGPGGPGGPGGGGKGGKKGGKGGGGGFGGFGGGYE